jgi:hypothetical protein
VLLPGAGDLGRGLLAGSGVRLSILIVAVGRLVRMILGAPAIRGWLRLGRGLLLAVLALGIVVGLVATATAGAAQNTALMVQVASPARAVHGSDGREHVEYDLVLTNVFTVPVGFESVRVFSHGKRLLALSGKRLAAHTYQLQPGGEKPTATIPVSSAVKTLVDVILPRSFGRRVPRRLTEQIRYILPRRAPLRALIGTNVVPGPAVRVAGRAPIRIASPLYGSGWANVNGCCAQPGVSHRADITAADGSYRTPELFAIDWIREAGGSYFKGDGSKLTDWFCYGTPIHAVANGIVVAVINNRPDVPPNPVTPGNPTVQKSEDITGNRVVERIAPGEYAAYVHMKTGSVGVKVGQRLRTGQVIGLLGNSGNTTAPHLHFGIQDGPDVLTSNSLPYAIGSFTVQGTIRLGGNPFIVSLTGKPHRATLSLPLFASVFDFSG